MKVHRRMANRVSAVNSLTFWACFFRGTDSKTALLPLEDSFAEDARDSRYSLSSSSFSIVSVTGSTVFFDLRRLLVFFVFIIVFSLVRVYP